ncbi:hypothetical protein QYE76_034780 [Lolium multiflorum]|uniref:Uncharacterized protein n=1 Tax=Lolium multiflorum TaxID=4521 RepID=A0AAD8QYQ4_LOLMU|nr:hypothetical protein QYE76_034780 [Lolium multiflorum]
MWDSAKHRQGEAVMDRRTTLYNRAVTHYHKAKLDRADLARELEAAKVEAAKVPQLESDLRAARDQCAVSEEAGRSAARKLKLAEQELTRLRQLEQNHLTELNSLRTAEKEKVDDLSRRSTEAEKGSACARAGEEVTTKSTLSPANAATGPMILARLIAFGAAFPETQEAALTAVGVARDSRRRETGEGSSEYFSMEDHLASMAARIEAHHQAPTELLRRRRAGAPRVGWFKRLRQEDISRLISRDERRWIKLDRAGSSHARLAAAWRLSFVLSWYNEVDLGQLEFRRAGVEDKLPVDLKAARLARASTIAEFVDKTLFVADPNPPLSDEDYMDDEEVEDAPEDDPAAGSTDAPPA